MIQGNMPYLGHEKNQLKRAGRAEPDNAGAGIRRRGQGAGTFGAVVWPNARCRHCKHDEFTHHPQNHQQVSEPQGSL